MVGVLVAIYEGGGGRDGGCVNDNGGCIGYLSSRKMVGVLRSMQKVGYMSYMDYLCAHTHKVISDFAYWVGARYWSITHNAVRLYTQGYIRLCILGGC